MAVAKQDTRCRACDGFGRVKRAHQPIQVCPECRGSGQGKLPDRGPPPPKPKFAAAPPADPFDTLAIAREQLKAALNEGATCPCCGRFARRYKYKLNSQAASFLCYLWRAVRDLDPGAVVHVRDFLPPCGHKASSDGTNLRYWDLIERGEKRGEWAITPKGERFVKGFIRLPRFVFTYDHQREGFGDDSTDIHEALDDRFDYEELMAPVTW